MTLLRRNLKMRKSSTDTHVVYNWTLPAGEACPSKGVCATGCYAQSGAYTWPAVSTAHHRNWDLSKQADFATLMEVEVTRLFMRSRKPDQVLMVRIHDAGDFYSLAYWKKWIAVIDSFRDSSHIGFYAYTKEVKVAKRLRELGYLPRHLQLIYSEGGIHDALIDREKDRHCRIFGSTEELLAAGYADASHDDLVSALGENNRIGIVYHGAASKEWTT